MNRAVRPQPSVRAQRCAICILGALLAGALSAEPRQPDSGRVVSRSDDGKTITFRPGERFVVDLGAGYGWSVDVGAPGVVELVENVMVVDGAQGMYEAQKAGKTTVTGSGVPECMAASPPCEARTVKFKVSVQVRGAETRRRQ